MRLRAALGVIFFHTYLFKILPVMYFITWILNRAKLSRRWALNFGKVFFFRLVNFGKLRLLFINETTFFLHVSTCKMLEIWVDCYMVIWRLMTSWDSWKTSLISCRRRLKNHTVLVDLKSILLMNTFFCFCRVDLHEFASVSSHLICIGRHRFERAF